ncbi:MAG: DNA polymerase III subunit beta [Rhizorhabdus sp.]
MTNFGNFAATLDRKALADAVKLLGKLVEKRNTIPILSCLLLECDGTRVMLRGTDLDIYGTVTLDSDDCQPGQALVPCDQLAKALAKSKGSTARLASVPGGVALTLESGATARLATPPKSVPSDMPNTFPGVDKVGAAGDFAAAQLRDDLKRVRVAVSTEETRYYLNGVYAHMLPYEPGKMAFASTDGHRLCIQHRAAPEGLEIPATIIPRKTVDMMLHAMAKTAQASARLAFGAQAVRFEHGSLVLQSKTVDGTFPDYTRVVPSSRERVLRVDAGALGEAAKSVTASMSGKVKAMCLTMHSVDGWLTAAARDADGNLSAMTLNGADVEALTDKAEGQFFIGMNAGYLAELAGLFPGQVALHFGDESSPLIMDSPSVEDFRVVLMPMRADGGDISPATIADMNKPAPTALEVLDRDGPALVADLAGNDANVMRRNVARRLGGLIKAAISQVQGASEDRRAARLHVLAVMARIRGDHALADCLTARTAHCPASSFRAWSTDVAQRLPYAGPTFNVVAEPVEQADTASGDVAALKALVLDMAARLARLEARGILEGADAGGVAQGRPARSEAHAATIRRAWEERRERRALAARLGQAVDTIETVTAQRNDYKRIAESETVRADQAEGMVATLKTRVGRLTALVQGRKAKLARMARDLIGSRTEAARLTRELATHEGQPKRGMRSVGFSTYAMGRKA